MIQPSDFSEPHATKLAEVQEYVHPLGLRLVPEDSCSKCGAHMLRALDDLKAEIEVATESLALEVSDMVAGEHE